RTTDGDRPHDARHTTCRHDEYTDRDAATTLPRCWKCGSRTELISGRRQRGASWIGVAGLTGAVRCTTIIRCQS
ncbi:MAG: hypothetical protein OXK79_10515, partial [Chloroflexota bacterium]|nr:hypothetical protein [Chloroflexota bacterium]